MVVPRITPDRIRNVPVVSSGTPSNRICTGPTNEYPCSRGCSRARGGRPPLRPALEPHRPRADERVPLLAGVLTGQRGQLDPEAVGVDLQPLVVGLRQLDHEVVGYQRPALRDDRRPVIHLPLHGAGHFDRLQLRFEGPREGTFDHPFQAMFKPLQDSHRRYLLSLLASDRIGDMGALADVLTSLLPRAGGGTADAHGSGPCVREDVRVQIPPRPRDRGADLGARAPGSLSYRGLRRTSAGSRLLLVDDAGGSLSA